MPYRIATLLAALAFGTTACSDRSDPALYLEANGSIQIQPSVLRVADGETVPVEITLRDGEGRAVAELPTGVLLDWSSFAPTVAGVEGGGLQGVIRGMRPGRTALRVALGTLTATADIIVAPVATQVISQGPPVAIGLAGEVSGQPARVQVQDRHGSPVEGALVRFEVVSGGGTVTHRTRQSDQFGFAETPWTLGSELGLQSVEARVLDGPSTQLFAYVNGDLATVTLSAVAGSASGTVGQPLSEMLEIRARDAQGRPVLGLGVEWFTTSGQLLPTSPVTDLTGRARARWILGPKTGTQTASVRLTRPALSTPGQALAHDLTITFQTEAHPAAAVRISTLPDRVVLPIGHSARVNAAVLDALDNRLPGPYDLEWRFEDSGIASISPDPSGDAIVSGNRIGHTRLIVSQGALVDTVQVIVQATHGGGEDSGSGSGGDGEPDEEDQGPLPSTLTLTPTHLSLQVGQSGELTATHRDSEGELLPTGDAVWTSDDPTVASIDGVGRVTAHAEGSAQIRVTIGPLQAVSTVFVRTTPQPPGDGPPSPITDVTVVGATETSVDLRFTAGHDGADGVAWHEIRYSPAPIGWGWGQATVHKVGSCASPIVPRSAGEVVQCRIGNLAPGRSYDFQMVSWRPDPAGWIYSPLSSPARGTTLAAPDLPDQPDQGVQRIAVSPGSATLERGASRQLSATAFDASDRVVSGVTFNWRSSNTGVATVSATGRVTGVGEGAATITVEADGRTASMFVSVSGGSDDAVASITLQPSSLILEPGQAFTLQAVARSNSGTSIPGVSFTWGSLDPSVASVNSSGRVVAHAPGSTTIGAQGGGQVATVQVSVRASHDNGGGGVPALLTVSPASSSLDVGGSISLTAQIFDALGAVLPGMALTWSSDNPAVATVNSTGRVTGRASGSTVIRVEGGGLSASAAILVRGAAGDALYPNRPSGMSVVAHWDGTEASHLGWETWSGWSSHVRTVSDPSNPLGTGRALQFDYGSGDNSAGNAGIDTFAGGPYKELYIMYRVKYDPNWEMQGHKHFYWGAAKGSRRPGQPPTQYYVTFESNYGAKITEQNVRSVNLFYTDRAWESKLGQWVNVEIRAVAESKPGAGDGQVYYWHDGVLLGSNTSVTWTQPTHPLAAFDGFQWYASRNDRNNRASWFRVGELLISGR